LIFRRKSRSVSFFLKKHHVAAAARTGLFQATHTRKAVDFPFFEKTHQGRSSGSLQGLSRPPLQATHTRNHTVDSLPHRGGFFVENNTNKSQVTARCRV